jgi:serine phosphatase RsbU (regulator of sigma subunit)
MQPMETASTSGQYRIETLRKCVFLEGLEESVLEALALKAGTLRIDAGSTIVTAGETGSTMYFIISCQARVHHGEVTVATLNAGDVFGEMAVLDSEVRSASVTSACESLLLSVERDDFYRALSANPESFKAVIRAILNREREIIHEVKTRSIKLLSYEKEMEIGRRIQKDFLPKSMPEPDNWEIASFFEAAREVAGDFYDVFQLKTSPHLAIVIGDVCDKGVGAALFMTLFRSLIRASSLYGFMGSSLVDAGAEDTINTPAGVIRNSMQTTNRYIATTHAGSSMFASVFFGLLDTRSGELTYANAGHEAPMVFRSNGEVDLLDVTGGVVGLFPAASYGVESVRLKPGDLIYTYTDGVNEAKNRAGEQFNEERILEAARPEGTDISDFLRAILDAVREFRGDADQSDDITMLALRFASSAAPG